MFQNKFLHTKKILDGQNGKVTKLKYPKSSQPSPYQNSEKKLNSQYVTLATDTKIGHYRVTFFLGSTSLRH